MSTLSSTGGFHQAENNIYKKFVHVRKFGASELNVKDQNIKYPDNRNNISTKLSLVFRP